MSNEITISWGISPSVGATYNVYRGTASGNESNTPYATGITNPTPLALSSVAASVGNQATYTGTITGGASNAFAGISVTISGFANSPSNGAFVVNSSTATTITVTNSFALAETVSASALLSPYYTDIGVVSGGMYSYEITAVVNAVESVDSVELLVGPVPFAPTPLPSRFGRASSFVVLGAAGVTNTGTSTADGDVGTYPNASITGFGPPSSISGAFHGADFVAQNAQNDAQAAYTDASTRAGATVLSASSFDLTSSNLAPGVYSIGSTAALSGAMTLNAGGNPAATWIFQIGTSLTVAASASMVLTNGAQANNVFWAVGSAATIGASALVVGNVVAQAGVTVGANSTVNGRLVSTTASVTLISDVVDLILSASLAVYTHNTIFNEGQVVYASGNDTYQQVVTAGTSGPTTPNFQSTFGATTVDGSELTWVVINPALAQVLVSLPPSPPNVPPPPPSAPTNIHLASES